MNISPTRNALLNSQMLSQHTATICKSIDEGKNVYTPLDSAIEAEALFNRLKARSPQVTMALFTAANKSQYDQSDINSLVQQYCPSSCY
ncbi:hypothetical protein [Nostoc sp.]